MAIWVSLRELTDMLGPAAAQLLVDALGGVERQYIPKIADPANHLAGIVGVAGLKSLVETYGGEHIGIPRGGNLGAAKVRVVLALDAGLTPRSAALAAKCSQRYVRVVQKGIIPDAKQLDMFPETKARPE